MIKAISTGERPPFRAGPTAVKVKEIRMQKRMILLAVASALSGTVYAQTNVTMYGIVDVGYVYSKTNDLSFSGLDNGLMSGSRLGFRGTEALGNGLSAVFQAEFGFKADQYDSKGASAGAGAFNNVRNSWVGLRHADYGTLSLGRQNSVAYDWVAKGFSSDVTVTHPSNTILSASFAQLNTGDRVNNSVKYQSPNWNGLEVRGIYGFGEVVGTVANPGDSSDAGRYGIGAAYKNGPIDVALIYQGIARNDTVANDGSVNGWSLGGSYDFKVVKVFAQYQMESNKNSVGGAKSDIDKDAWTLGVRVPVTKAGTAVFEYLDYKADSNNASDDVRTKGWGLGYEHAFSKRTTGYTSIGYIDNNDQSSAAFNGVGLAGQNNKTFSLGVRHSF